MTTTSTATSVGAVPLTCAVDGRSHYVTAHAFGLGQRYGCYRALCGHTVTAVAMVCPDGEPCPSCHDHVLAVRTATRTRTGRPEPCTGSSPGSATDLSESCRVRTACPPGRESIGHAVTRTHDGLVCSIAA